MTTINQNIKANLMVGALFGFLHGCDNLPATNQGEHLVRSTADGAVSSIAAAVFNSLPSLPSSDTIINRIKQFFARF